MPLADDIANDYTYFDGLETVTFTPRNPTGAAVPNVKGLRRVQEQTSIAATSGAMPSEPIDVVFHLWTATLGGAVPKNGDSLTDSLGTVWTILDLQKTTLGTRYRAACRKSV
jgi:hypothetical protein